MLRASCRCQGLPFTATSPPVDDHNKTKQKISKKNYLVPAGAACFGSIPRDLSVPYISWVVFCVTQTPPWFVCWRQKVSMFLNLNHNVRGLCVNMYPLLLSIIVVSYTKNPGYTLENPKWVERVVTLTIRSWRRKSRVLQICIHLYCAILGVSHTQNPGYTLENPKWGERLVVLAIPPQKNKVFSNMYPHLLCNPRGLIYN